MNSSTLNSSTDYFILDRDQDAAPVNPRAHSTPKALGDNCENTQTPIIEDIYEIINTGTEHIVLYHESAPISILETAQSDTLPSRKFTNFNPIIPDDEFMSPLETTRTWTIGYTGHTMGQSAPSPVTLVR